jgi:hypothetical protein
MNAIGDSTAAYRTRDERRTVVAERFRKDCDCWFATSHPDDGPYIVPLSFLIVGPTALLATAPERPTVRNVQLVPSVALALGGYDDAIRAYGDCDVVTMESIAPDRRKRYVEKAGWDPFVAGSRFVALVVRLQKVLCSRSPAEDRDRVVWKHGDPTPW